MIEKEGFIPLHFLTGNLSSEVFIAFMPICSVHQPPRMISPLRISSFCCHLSHYFSEDTKYFSIDTSLDKPAMNGCSLAETFAIPVGGPYRIHMIIITTTLMILILILIVMETINVNVK
jgi:hypothetical protein